MGELYTMKFLNATDKPWYFAVYKSIPDSPELSSVAWQVQGLPPQQQGNPPPSALVEWNMSYGICVASFDGDKFAISQSASANLGDIYEVTSMDYIPSINPVPTGTTTSDLIMLTNSTMPAQEMTMGFTLSNNIVVAERNVGAGQRTFYRAHPEYYVACYRNMFLGQLVDKGVSIGPVEVKYDGGTHARTVQATKTASGEYIMEVIE